MKSIIYTRTGDTGTTSLVGGERVAKCCTRLDAYGTIDELNSQIGLLVTYVDDAADRALLTDIQHTLFVVGSYLATDTTCTDLPPSCTVTPDMVARLEQAIDTIDEHLPRLRAFVLPGGTRSAALAHVCRTVCRRAERKILQLHAETALDPCVLTYVNRLSDFFFVLARKLNICAQHEEILWSPRTK